MANTTLPNEQQVAQKALEKVRALCKGNGVKASDVTLAKHNVKLHALHASTYLELKPVMSEKIAPGKVVVGTQVGTREEVTRLMDQEMVKAANDQATKLQMASILLNRPDKGFGLHHQNVPLDFLKREYTYHDRCNSCNASGTMQCQKCHGRKTEPCIKCSARGLMICPQCRGTGLLQGVKCTRCHGQRYVPCDVCHRSGNMQCRTCHATGAQKCGTCGGVGWKSHIVTLGAMAMTYFDYDAKSIPQWAADQIESRASELAEKKTIKIEGRTADDKENVLGASYDVTFPYGETTFMIGKKEVDCAVFGYGADLVNFPAVLDKLVQKGVDDLEEAANDVGDVADKIRKATKYRLIAQGVLLSARLTPKKAIGALLHKYPEGLTHTMAEKIVMLAERATTQIAKKPRLHGLLAGITGAAIGTAAFYLLPVRSSIAAHLPHPRYDAVLDILPLVLGGMGIVLAIQLSAARSMKNALGHLIKENGGKRFLPKAGSGAAIGWAACAALCLIMMEIAFQMSAPAPYWYVYLRGILMPAG